MGQQVSKVPSDLVLDFLDPAVQDYFLQKGAYTGCFVGLLLLLNWWHGQSNFEKSFDPVEAAHEERDAAINERDDAQRAWGEAVASHERVLKRLLEVQSEYNKAFRDLPWLTQRNFELAEQNTVQHNEIERLKSIQQKYDRLQDEVSTYGMTAKRPEFHQKMAEDVQRKLEITNNWLQKSQRSVAALEEQLIAHDAKANKEIEWLRALLKKNSRSAAYLAKFRTINRTLESKPVWGVHCACTNSEIAYSLKDQTPRIAELEATVAARDQTIIRLRASHGNVLENDTTSVSNTSTTTLVHTCEHEQQCKTLSNQVADDAETIRQLRKECQDLKDAASNESTADATGEDAKAKLEGDLTAKVAVIEELREEKGTANKELAAKNKEIDDLHEEKKSVEENATTKISSLGQELVDSRKELVDAQNTSAECEVQVRQQQTKINELESAQRELEDAIKQKDLEIKNLEQANQEIAEQPARESPETLQRLETAKTDLDELHRRVAECKDQSETQITRIRELEDAGRNLEATTKFKDDRIATLEEQINGAPTSDFVERQLQSHNEAIRTKDRDYRMLYDHYQLAETQRNEAIQAFNTLQQSDAAKQLDLQRVYTDYGSFRNLHANCDGRINDLNSQLRQGANTYTDLQIKYNTQAMELDTANSDACELRGKIDILEQENANENANLEQRNTSPEIDYEKYRLEGEERARPTWQANFDREMSTQASKLETSEGLVFKLKNQLQQLKHQTNPLREMNLQSREDAVKAREDALIKPDTDAMDQDQPASSASKEEQEVEILEGRLVLAAKEARDAKVRSRGIQSQLNKERQERKEEKERHVRELRKEQEDAKKRSDVLKLRLEKENPLRDTVGHLQNEIARLRNRA